MTAHSALLSAAGASRGVLRACLSGRALPLMGTALLHEYEDLISRPALMSKSPLSPDERRQLLESFLSVCDWVHIYFLWRPNLPDEADNHLVELAVAGGACAIVTSNLRDLKRGELSFPGLRVLTPAEFLKSNLLP
jgi:predicted nucleic acid-binding protein